MPSPHAGHQQVKTLTATLIVIGAAGAISCSVVAFTDTRVSTPATTTPAGSQSVESGSTDSTFGSAPQLSPTSGRHHATSGGS